MPLALVDHITLRHRYIFDFLFNDVLNLPVILTENRTEFQQSMGPKFSYSQDPLEGVLNFQPFGLLSETGLHTDPVEVIEYNGIKVFFPGKNQGALPFDPFSMAFYIITRMEEYLPFDADGHDRFTEKNSLQHQAGILQEPIVNRLAFLVFEMLKQKFPQLQAHSNFSFLPTIDVDIAFAHLGKDPLRAAGGFAKLLLKGDFQGLKERLLTIRGKMKDPYDNFDLHLEVAKRHSLSLVYFYLVGDYGKYDKMISYKNSMFRALIQKTSKSAQTGIHPSYSSFEEPQKVKTEIRRLEEITGKPIDKHRAHFLRIKFPGTFRALLKMGIREDYSLGYSGVNGFRAGTATPFYFYDLEKEEITSLRLHPFIFMDSAMVDHLKLSPGEAEKLALELINKVKRWGGEAIGVWHNYILCEKGPYSGWQEFFKNTMARAGQ